MHSSSSRRTPTDRCTCRQFQAFADASGNTRAHGSPGYVASADYVFSLAQDAGLEVVRQPVGGDVGFLR